MAKKREKIPQVKWVQTAPEDWKPVIDMLAASQGMKVNEWVRNAILARMPPEMAAKLSKPARIGRPSAE